MTNFMQSENMRNLKGQFMKGHALTGVWTTERRKKLSDAMKQRRADPKVKAEYSARWSGENNSQFGKKVNEKQLEGLKLGWKTNHVKGEGAVNWKGGITPEHKLIRNSKAYQDWRTKVFKRDNHTCQECGDQGYLNAHHIKPFAKFPEFRFDVDNGITVCLDCHNVIERGVRVG